MSAEIDRAELKAFLRLLGPLPDVEADAEGVAREAATLTLVELEAVLGEQPDLCRRLLAMPALRAAVAALVHRHDRLARARFSTPDALDRRLAEIAGGPGGSRRS